MRHRAAQDSSYNNHNLLVTNREDPDLGVLYADNKAIVSFQFLKLSGLATAGGKLRPEVSHGCAEDGGATCRDLRR